MMFSFSIYTYLDNTEQEYLADDGWSKQPSQLNGFFFRLYLLSKNSAREFFSMTLTYQAMHLDLIKRLSDVCNLCFGLNPLDYDFGTDSVKLENVAMTPVDTSAGFEPLLGSLILQNYLGVSCENLGVPSIWRCHHI